MTARSDALADVTAVIVNRDGGERVIETLRHLARQVPPLPAILVIDDASEDGSPERIEREFPEVRVVRLGRNVGLPAGRNVALGEVTTGRVLMVDADVYLAEDAAALLARALDEERATVACPRVLYHPGEVIQADGAAAHFVGTMTLRHGGLPATAAPTARAEVGGCIGACLLLDRHTVLEMGGFDEEYFLYFEDHEFGLRVRSQGGRIVCEPAARVIHDRGEGTPGLAFRGAGRYPTPRAYQLQRNRLFTVFAHYRLRTLLVLAPALAAYEVLALAAAVARGWTGAWFRAWVSVIEDRSLLCRRRRRIQSWRRVPDRELLSAGPVPVAPGLVRSRLERDALAVAGAVLNAYWALARRWIG